MKQPRKLNHDLFELPLERPAPPAPPAEREEVVLTVSALAALARGTLERTFSSVWVSGEVTGWKRYGSSGHCYFSLRDANAQIRCVMFRMEAQQLPVDPDEGMQVRVLGRLTLYDKKGDVQFVVRELEAKAVGGLWRVAFEKLRAKLDAEGLLAPARKRPLPPFPMTVGVVTSPVGAAFQDILHVIRRRAPWVRVLISPAKVQGEGASGSVSRALRRLGRMPEVDVIIVGRGGGSMEDLWAFNEEPVARAIASCPIPVISAVGHETDFTIADLVADVRAPTPSAAAERAVPDGLALAAGLRVTEVRLRQALVRGVTQRRDRLSHMGEELEDCMRQRLQRQRERMGQAGESLAECIHDRIVRHRDRLGRMAHTLEALSPLRILARGYAVAQDEGGRVVRNAHALPRGARFLLRLPDGTVRATSDGPVEER